MHNDTKENPRRRYRLDLDTHMGVMRCMQRVIKDLRALPITDPVLDPIRVNRAKTVIGGLKVLAELIAVGGIGQLPDEVLVAEVVRRRDARLGHTSLTAAREQ